MSGLTIITNKDEALKKKAKEHFEALKKNNLLYGSFEVKDHESKIEWIFKSYLDAVMATYYLCDYFEYCHRF